MTIRTRGRTVLVVLLVGVLFIGGQASLVPARSAETAVSASSTTSGTVDWNDVRQEIDGFGGSGAFNQAGRLMAFPPADRRHILDLLFCKEQIPVASAPPGTDGLPVCQSPGIGASMVRNQIKACGVPGYFCWKDQDVDQVWLMREARARGTTRFFSTAWSAPGYMKTNGTYNNGGEVKPEMYTLYANYLAEYVAQMKNDKGLDIEAVSVTNEPEVTVGYDSMRWTGEQLRTFIRDALRPVFALRGTPSKVIVPESVGWYESKALPTLNDPVAEPRLDIVAAHGYDSFDPQPFAKAREKGKRVWQTEDSDLGANDPGIANAVGWASKIHRYLTQAEVNAWSYWWFVTETANGQSLINLDVANKTYLVNKRMYAMGNFSRFVRPGWKRIGVTAPSPNTTLVSSFKDPATGEFAVVAVNNSSAAQPLELGLNGFRSDSVVPYTTSGTQDLQAGAPISTSSGQLVTTLPAKSVTTFVGRGASTSPLNLKVSDGVVWSGLAGSTELTVENVSGAPVSATVIPTGSAGLLVAPAQIDVTLAPGESRKFPATLTVGDTTATVAEYRLDVAAQVRDDPATTVRARSLVRYFTSVVDFCPNTALEKVWMREGDSAVLPQWVLPGCLGNPRFADGSAKALYRFELPADTVGGTLTLDIGNQFLVETSTDLATWRTVLNETDTTDNARTLKNRAKRALDLNELRSGGQVVYVRIGDSQPADGWGGLWTSVRLDVARATFSAPAAVAEGSDFPLAITGADPAAGYQFAFDCGAGSGPFGPDQSATCSAGDNGTLAVGAKLRSASGAVAEYRRSVRVDNVAPTVAAPLVRSDPSGAKAVASTTFSDPGPADGPFTCTVDYGDGAGPQPGVVSGSTCTGQLHRYRGNGTFLVTISVSDKDGGSGIASATYRLR